MESCPRKAGLFKPALRKGPNERRVSVVDLTLGRTYRKPQDICKFSPQWENISSPEEVARYIDTAKKEIEEKVSRLGLRLRVATMDDLEGILELHRRSFPPGTLNLEDPYVLFRIISFGYSPVVTGADSQILGCNICEGHDDPDRTAYGVRITVDQGVAGNNLGAELVRYSCLIGMQRGSRIRRGLLSPTNYGSASNFLNYVGYLGESFNPNLPGFGPRFTVALPLTPAGMMNNRIDLDKLKTFIERHKKNQDYRIVACEDLEEVTRLYQESPFRVAAFIRGGTIWGEQNAFFALPKEVLGLP